VFQDKHHASTEDSTAVTSVTGTAGAGSTLNVNVPEALMVPFDALREALPPISRVALFHA
jgi:hypothetical protein